MLRVVLNQQAYVRPLAQTAINNLGRIVTVEKVMPIQRLSNLLNPRARTFSSASSSSFDPTKFKKWIKNDPERFSSIEDESDIPAKDQHIIPILKDIIQKNNSEGDWRDLYKVWKHTTHDARQLTKATHLHTIKNPVDFALLDSASKEAARGKRPTARVREKLAEWEDVYELPKYNPDATYYVGKEFTGANDPPVLKREYQSTVGHHGANFLYDYVAEVSRSKDQIKTPNVSHSNRHIFQPKDIDWDSIPPFVISSRDPTMRSLSKLFEPKFTSSTSSFTGLLGLLELSITRTSFTHSHLLGSWTKNVTRRFTRSALRPVSVILRRRGDNLWGCDTFPSGDPKPNDILIDLGKSLELQLTTSNDQFISTYLSDEALEKHQLTREEKNISHVDFNSHQYMTYGNILLRSQLDCIDHSIPGNRKVFDLKTRATVPIRYDVSNFDKYLEYKVVAEKGMILSTEREKYDMIRSAYLKYMLQCKIGNMSGILVAYHNTAEMFALEYIRVEEMCRHLFGSPEIGDLLFNFSLGSADELLSKIVSLHGQDPNVKAIRITLSPQVSHLASSINGLDIIVETPDAQENDVSDETILCDRHLGPMHVDSMSPEAVLKALARRGMKDQGADAFNRAQLEAYVCPPSGALSMTRAYATERVRNKNVSYYTLQNNVTLDGTPVSVKNLTSEQLPLVSLSTSLKKHVMGDWVAPIYMEIYNNYHSSDTSTPTISTRGRPMGDNLEENITLTHLTYYQAARKIIDPIVAFMDKTMETNPELIRDLEAARHYPEKVQNMVKERFDFPPLEKFKSVKEVVDYMFVDVSKFADDIKRLFEKDICLLPSYLRTSDQFSSAVSDASEVAQLMIKKLALDKVSEKRQIVKEVTAQAQLESNQSEGDSSSSSQKLNFKSHRKVGLGYQDKKSILEMLSSGHVMQIAQAITDRTHDDKTNQEHCADLLRRIKESPEEKGSKSKQATSNKVKTDPNMKADSKMKTEAKEKVPSNLKQKPQQKSKTQKTRAHVEIQQD